MDQPSSTDKRTVEVSTGGDMPDAEMSADASAAGAAAAREVGGGAETDRPLADMLRIAAPVVVAMTSYTLMQAVDKLMVSRIGPDPIYVGAQGNGGLASWVPLSIVVGTINVINTYVSQNLGNKTPERGPRYAWAGVWIAVLAWIPLLAYGLLMERMFLAMGHDPARAAMEASYGRPLVLASVITLSARGFSQFFYGMHMPWVVLAAELGANVTNFVLNSMFIYGPTAPEPSGIVALDWWYGVASSVSRAAGIERMGVHGAALGTVCATVVELAIPMAVFLSPKFHRLYGTRASWRPSARAIKDILRIGWPGGLMFGNEMVCWGFFMVFLVGGFGEFHSNAGWIAHQWMSLSFMPAVGISVAITASVGKCMGARRPDLAAKRAWLGLSLAAGYMTTMGVLFVVFREQMVRFFISGETPPDEARQILEVGTKFMIATATFQLFDGIAMSLSGALRGAGDTVWIGVVTVVLSWTVIVGGGLALVRFAPSLGSLGPWIAASTYIMLLACVGLYRFLSGKWRHIQLIEGAGPVAHA